MNITAGRIVSWLALYMVLVQFGVVVLRYVFSISFIATVESVIYAHGLLFMLGAGYTLLRDGHVRVDVFFREMQPRKKAWVDLLGATLLLLPVMMLLLWTSWSLVIHAWQSLEGSEEAGGLPLLFLYKTVIWLFAVLVGAQGLAMGWRAWLFLQGGQGDNNSVYHANPDEKQLSEGGK